MEAARFLGAFLAAAAFGVAWFPAVTGVWFYLPQSGSSKCVYEELRSNLVVMGDYYAFYGGDYNANDTDAPSLTVKVDSPIGIVLHENRGVNYGQFSFTTKDAGSYKACFKFEGNSVGKKVTVGIDWRTGIATKDWDVVAKKEKIEGLELELKKLAEIVEDVHQRSYRLVEREWELWGVSDDTNDAVEVYSIFSLALCIIVSLLQVCYLRRYFRQKKLI